MKICFAGGGTLGHVIPALSVINYKKDEWEFKKENSIYYIGSSNGLEPEVLCANIEKTKLLLVNMKGFNRKFLGLNIENIKTFQLYKKAKKEIEKFLDEVKPDVVIGMGGYIGFIAINTAIKRKIKTIIHEQNACFGLANKLLTWKVDKVIQSFKIKEDSKKYKTIGNPRKTEVFLKYKDVNIEKSRTLLVVGGSRGADKINEMIIASKSFFEKNEIYTTLITGKKYYINNQKSIEKNSNKYLKIIPFTNDLIYYLLYNQIIISRSGATTISEISALNKPCIYIPSPNVTNDHQQKNIKSLVKDGCGVALDENSLTLEELQNKVLSIMNDEKLVREIRSNLQRQNEKNIIEEFIKEIERVVNG